jgi:hypothetical protein
MAQTTVKQRPHEPTVGAAGRTLMVRDIPEKHILDTSAWNELFDDPERSVLGEKLDTKNIVPTSIAISEIAAIENRERRIGLLTLIKALGKDKRPLATPNNIIIMACQGYSRRAQRITLNAGDEAEGAWAALNSPDLIDEAAQRMSLDFNAKREAVFRTSNEGLRKELQLLFENGVERPRSLGALMEHYAKDNSFLYSVVNPLYERAVGCSLPESELLPLLKSLPHWKLFLRAYACGIFQRAVKEHGFGHRKNPGHLDLWSAVSLPDCEYFITHDRRQRRALKVLNKGACGLASILSYSEWRLTLLA